MSRYPSWAADVGDTGFLRAECEREGQEEQSSDLYTRLFEEADAKRRAEWIADGSDIEDYQLNDMAIHEEVSKIMDEMERDYEE